MHIVNRCLLFAALGLFCGLNSGILQAQESRYFDNDHPMQADSKPTTSEGVVQESPVKPPNNLPMPAPLPEPTKAARTMFGAQLFNGNFSHLYGGGFNPDYRINIGDTIVVRLWGAFEFDGKLKVDPQGNIFLPNVGPVAVAGTVNKDLNTLVDKQVRKVFKANVGIYTTLDVSQPVKVFVTGFVRYPGLYGGIASESMLSYLDRAGGVDPERGSYVDVVVKRGDQIRKQTNLYDFLLKGEIDYIQLQDGDTILVGPRKHTYGVFGEVYNPYNFEFPDAVISLQKALELAVPKPGATHVSVVRRQGSTKSSEYYTLAETADVLLHDGDQITVTSDRYAGTIQIRIEGAHSGEHAVILPYGASMKEVMDHIKPNAMSRMDAIQLYRRSVASRQKEVLELALNKLEEAAYSSRSKTSEEAQLRAKEAELISEFIRRARNVEPKGQVVLDKKSLQDILLEDGDIIHIPERSSVVTIHGEVMFPSAVSWRKGLDAEDYIKQVGGYTHKTDASKVVVMRPSGEVLSARKADDIAAGDEIMVLPKIDSKNIEVTRGISQILYHLAVAAKVIIDL